MIILLFLANFWGLFQMYVIASLSRTVRLRLILLGFATGIYGSALSTLIVQQLWIRSLAPILHMRTYILTDTAAYTVDPFIEEIFKIAPLFLIALWPRIRRQIGITDFMLLGASLGAGFGFTEALFRTIHSVGNAYWIDGSWFVSGALIPGVTKILFSWIPNPYMPLGMFGPDNFVIFGKVFDLVQYNHHLVWSALAGLGVGLFFRLPFRRVRWLALLSILWVGSLHAAVNYAASTLSNYAIWSWPFIVACASAGFGSLMGWYVLLGVFLAVAIDRFQISRALWREERLRFAYENQYPFGGFGTMLSSVDYLINPLVFFIQFRDYLWERRAFALYKARKPEDSVLPGLRESLTIKRAILEKSPGFFVYLRRSFLILKMSLKNKWFIIRGILYLLLGILILVPSILYFIVSVFPTTYSLQKYFTDPLVIKVLLGLQGLSLLWLLLRIIYLYRVLPGLSRQRNGAWLITVIYGGIISQGAFLVGMIGMLMAFHSGGDQNVFDVLNALHISSAFGDARILDLIMLGIAIIAVIGIIVEFPIWVTAFVTAVTIADSAKTILDLTPEALAGDLTPLEQLDYAMAWIGIIIPEWPLDLPYPEELNYLDDLNSWYGLAEKTGQARAGLYPSSRGWDFPTQTSAIHQTYDTIRRGDTAMQENKPDLADDLYKKALEKGNQANVNVLTRAALFVRIAETRRSIGDINGAIDSYRQALDLLKQVNAAPEEQAKIIEIINELEKERK